MFVNTFKYHVIAPMGRFQLELIYLYFPPFFHLTVVVSVLYEIEEKVSYTIKKSNNIR